MRRCRVIRIAARCCRMMASEPLYRMLPELCDELNVDAISPYLVSRGVVSVENFERLHLAKERETRRQLVFALMPMIRCPKLFLSALEESKKDEPNHASLAKRLREEVHVPCTYNGLFQYLTVHPYTANSYRTLYAKGSHTLALRL